MAGRWSAALPPRSPSHNLKRGPHSGHWARWSDDSISRASGSTLYGTPGDGMEYAYNTFGTRYFELYTADLDAALEQAELQHWHDFLHTLPVP